MKKIIGTVIIFLIFGILINTYCIATSDPNNKNQIYIPLLEMRFELDNEFYDIIQGLEENDEKVKDWQNSKNNFIQLGIVFDAVDSLEDNISKEIVIINNKNQTTEKIVNLAGLNEEELVQISESFFNEIKEDTQESQLNETKIEKSKNGNIYMTVTLQQNTDTGTINAKTYYTVIAKRLVGITFRYINKELDNNEIMEVIESITFDITQIEANENAAITRTFVAYGVIVFGVIVFGIIKRKTSSKKPMEIDEKQKNEYKKIGGLLLFFIATLGLITLNTITGLKTINQLEQITIRNVFYIQYILNLVIIAYIIFLIIKRKEKKTPKKIEKALIVMGIINIISSVIRICVSMIDTETFYTLQYYVQETLSLTTNVSYMILWSTYFAVSKRIYIYYTNLE